MGRINGINSDYAMKNGAVGPVFPPAKPPMAPLPSAPRVDMKLFICPYNQPNGLEAEGTVCTGVDASCPHVPEKTGHALLSLNQDQGIQLIAGPGNKVQIDQSGAIVLAPTTKVVVGKTLEITADSQTFTVTPSSAGITLQHANGARVVFKANGDMELVTKNNSGTVSIQGNLVVSGTVMRNGQVI
jgi:hypothetical protein